MKPEGLRKSQMHEKRLAKKTGGQVSAGSGAFWSRKGDVRTDDLLIEHKYTSKSSFTLTAKVLEKIVTEAIMDGRMPVLGIHLNGRDYVVLEEADFFTLRQEAQEITGGDTP